MYEVVWESTDGELFGVEIPATTEGVENFTGAVQLNNLPETSSRKTIYRTDNTGEGDRKQVGTLPAQATTFVDTTSDNNRAGAPLTELVNKVTYASVETVTLDNVGEIRPPSN